MPKSRLTLEEQKQRIDDITTRPEDTEGEATVLRFMGKEMLKDPFGWSAIYGQPGNAKSLYLTALVAEFCRAGRQAMYFNADEIASLMMPGDGKEIDGVSHIAGNPDAAMALLKRVPILAIDEIDKLGWSIWQIQKIGALLEYRHRNAATQVTLFSMNLPPWKWKNAENSTHLLDRFNDGRFNRFWPAGLINHLPPRLKEYTDQVDGEVAYYAPGLFETRLSSIRQQLRRA